MRLKFIDFEKSIYVVIGYTYDNTKPKPDCFVAIPLHKSIYSSMIVGNSINIPIAYAEEITDKKRLLTILVLYG